MAGHLLPAVDTVAANATSRQELNSQTNNSLRPPTSVSSLSLSPITFSGSLHSPTISPQGMQELTQVANGFVGGASPSFINTNFPSFPTTRSTDTDHTLSAGHSLSRSMGSSSAVHRPSSSASVSTLNSEATSPSYSTQQDTSMDADSPLVPSITGGGTRTRRQKEKRYRDDGTDEEEDRFTVQKPKAPLATSFIYKLYDILEDQSNHHLISFGPLEGSIEVYDIVTLARDVLPLYFKHSNFASFVRQLNMWGWKKEIRHGGWIFMHPIFRPGRRDLLSQIKRSDEGGKKKPDTVRPRMKTNRRPPTPDTDIDLELAPKPVALSAQLPSPPPPPPPAHSAFASTSAGQDRYPLFLDTSVPPHSSYSSTTRRHPHSAPALIEPTHLYANASYSLPPAPRLRQLDGPFSAPTGSHPSTSNLISPIFNADGTHPRPVLPPAFVDAPTSHQLPRPVFRNPGQHVPFNAAEALLQLEEAKKRLTLATSLMEHVFQRLHIEEGQEQFHDFPFYVFDPRFNDPGVPVRRIVDDHDAKRLGSSPHDSQQSPFDPIPYHLQRQQRSTASTSYDFPADSESNQPATQLFSPGVPLELTVPPSRPGTAGNDLGRRFNSSNPTTSPQANEVPLTGLGLSVNNFSGHSLAPTMQEEIYSHQLESRPMAEEQRLEAAEEFRPARPRRSSVTPVTAAPSLGPSPFSLVDFNDVRSATALGEFTSARAQRNREGSESSLQYQSPIEEEPTPRHSSFSKTGNTYP